MPARWFENVRMGELESGWLWPTDEGCENDIRPGNDQTWTLASFDPESIKLDVGSTTKEVTACKCDAEVETERPVHIYDK